MKKGDLNKIAKNKNITHCYIRKGSYYRPESCGYTDYITKAGVYKKEYAISLAINPELTIIPIDKNEHNKAIVDEVKDLMSRYI